MSHAVHKKKPVFVVEHFLDADDEVELNEWTELEYCRMLRDAGEDAVVFTRLAPEQGAPVVLKRFPNARFESKSILDLADEFPV